MTSLPLSFRPRAALRHGALAASALLVVVAALHLGREQVSDLAFGAKPCGAAALAALALYAALLALPFVPGAEIGLLLLFGFGAVMALPVYLATVAGLTLSFAAGRLAPSSLPRALLRRLGTRSPEAGEPASAPDVWAALSRDGGRPWLARLTRRRWLALIVLINLPGNSALGGGGGIALAAGLTRMMSLPVFLLCTAVAVAPVPLAVLLAGRFELAAMLVEGLRETAGLSRP